MSDVVVEPYRERPARIPGADLWTRTAEGGDYRILPDGCMDLLVLNDELVVAGPDNRAWTGNAERGTRYAGIRFPPGTAPGFLGVPARELLNERVGLGELWSPTRSRQLRDRILAAPDLATALDEEVAKVVDEPADPLIRQVLHVIRSGALRGIPAAAQHPPFGNGGNLIDGGDGGGIDAGGVRSWGGAGAGVDRHGRGGADGRQARGDRQGRDGVGGPQARGDRQGRGGTSGPQGRGDGQGPGGFGGSHGRGDGPGDVEGLREVGVARLAVSVGLSERQLHRRCLDAFGYGPKLLDRVLWMNVALDHARTGLPLAEVAALTGYADQAHLTRDVKALTGVPPRTLLS